MKCNWKRMLALVLAACLPFSGAALGVCAAAPAVTTDETAYVTLDYYGSIDHLSIVKACSLNGLTAFADYGKYQSVNNMTTLDEPVVFGDMVDWEITEEVPNRFYYEVVPEEQSITLPWSFDISYRLNGKPATGESLAGASGLIDIEASIVCERESHKGIIIGKGGSMLKRIGIEARKEIESMMDTQVNLQLWVKVRKEWRDSELYMKNYGYNPKDI